MRRFVLGICLLAAIANIDVVAQKRLTILHWSMTPTAILSRSAQASMRVWAE